jgi:hypothetical protein
MSGERLVGGSDAPCDTRDTRDLSIITGFCGGVRTHRGRRRQPATY